MGWGERKCDRKVRVGIFIKKSRNFQNFIIFRKFQLRPWAHTFSDPGPCPVGFLWWKFSWDIDLLEKNQSWHHQWLKISEKSKTDTRSHQFLSRPAGTANQRWTVNLVTTGKTRRSLFFYFFDWELSGAGTRLFFIFYSVVFEHDFALLAIFLDPIVLNLKP